MASRMDRYYSDKKVNRSSRNQDLYEKVHNNYSSDINSVRTINRVNEFDISRMKDIVNDRETFKRERKLKEAIDNSNLKIDIPSSKMSNEPEYDILDIKTEKIKKKIESKDRNYDISDVLTKAKDEYSPDEKNRNLKDLEYTDLNNLNLHKKEYKNSEAELRDLISTINNTSKYNNLGDDIGLLDSLKADTVVGDASSIKKVLDEEKREIRKDDTKELDKSFFTSTMDFSEVDFDEALAKSQSKKKKIIIIIIILLVVIITILTLYFFGVFDFIKGK